jgi:hypothetical protein
VPGNHERSRLPASLFLHHRNISAFHEPSTFRFDLGGARVALAGFPSVRKNVRGGFPELIAATGLESSTADIKLLCMHQIVEGASVGPSGYTFRTGHDVVRQLDLPACCDAVLAGHVHRHQVIQVERGGGRSVPVIYPGSTERTSFAEAEEEKGYCTISFAAGSDGAWALKDSEFTPLPSRPMVTIELPVDLTRDRIEDFLAGVAREVPPDAILRFRAGDGVPLATRHAFNTARVSACLPASVNYQFASGFFGKRRTGARP